MNLFTAVHSQAQDAVDPPVVTTELSGEEVWVGQGVDLILTLWAPGPFSGTAYFDFPRIPGTTFVRQGNPTIGSENRGGIEYFTQRHRFRVFAQQTGTINIPAFEVQFEAKRTFTGEPEPFQGLTEPVTFEAKQPPGLEGREPVVSATSMNVKQSWSPQPESHDFNAGDILTRTIERNATGTTAMMLSPFPDTPINGVRVYRGQPTVVDKTERGASSSRRVDVIKYQFERGGSFEISELEFSWWHPESRKVTTETFEGVQLKVKGPRIAMTQQQERQLKWIIPLIFLFVITAAWLFWSTFARRFHQWIDWRQRPELMSRKQLLNACRRNDAASTQSALLQWKASLQTDALHGPSYLLWIEHSETYLALEEAVESLAAQLYGLDESGIDWNGEPLRIAFLTQRKAWLSKRGDETEKSNLAQLNSV
ncbi:MAG: hypothetical protein AAGA96_01995 [Verrucomicrobiota bacterium]